MLNIIVFGTVGYSLTSAYFIDASNSIGNSFTSVAVFPSQASHIVINEVFVNGGADAEWIELFNPTQSAIDISGWIIMDKGSQETIKPGSPLIPSNGYAVVVASGSALNITSGIRVEVSSNTIGNGLTSEGSIVLKNNSNVDIDALSFGSDHTYFVLPAISGVNSLSRQPNGNDSNSQNDWILDSTPSMGSVN